MSLNILSAGYTTIDRIGDSNYIGGGATLLAINAKKLGYLSSLLSVLSIDQNGLFAKLILKKASIDIDFCFTKAPHIPTCAVPHAHALGSERKWIDNGAISFFKKISISQNTFSDFNCTFLVNCLPSFASRIACYSPQNLVYIPGPQSVLQPRHVREDVIRKAHYIFLNEEEAPYIWKYQPFSGKTEFVVVTKGEKGGEVFLHNGLKKQFRAIPVKNVIDTTGAGDVFALGFITTYLETNSITRAVENARILSSKIIQKNGGLL